MSAAEYTAALEPWQLAVLEKERREAERIAADRELAIGEWAFVDDVPERT